MPLTRPISYIRMAAGAMTDREIDRVVEAIMRNWLICPVGTRPEEDKKLAETWRTARL